MITSTRLCSAICCSFNGPKAGCRFISHGRGAPTACARATPGAATNIFNAASSRRYRDIGRSIPLRSPNPDPSRAGSRLRGLPDRVREIKGPPGRPRRWAGWVNAQGSLAAAEFPVIASAAKQSPSRCALRWRLPRRCAPKQETAAFPPSSWRGLAPPSTAYFARPSQDVDGRPPGLRRCMLRRP